MAFLHTFKYLYAGKEVKETKPISAPKAIRYHCLDCSGGSPAEVRGCGIPKCPLWPFRMGKGRPHLERKQQQREGLADENEKAISK